MAEETAFALALLGGFGVLFFAVAVASLREGQWVRSIYGVSVEDDTGARVNALILALVGCGLFALAGAIVLEVSPRVIGTTTVLGSAVLCVCLGWLIRYRDRRELLTTPGVDRRTARRLGAVTIGCGMFLFSMAPLLWFGVSEIVLYLIALGGSVVVVLALAFAYA